MDTEVYPGLDHVWSIHLVELRWKVFKWLLKILLTLPTACSLNSGLSAWLKPLKPKSSFYLPSSISISFHPLFICLSPTHPNTLSLNHLPCLNSFCLHTSETFFNMSLSETPGLVLSFPSQSHYSSMRAKFLRVWPTCLTRMLHGQQWGCPDCPLGSMMGSFTSGV